MFLRGRRAGPAVVRWSVVEWYKRDRERESVRHPKRWRQSERERDNESERKKQERQK